MIELWAVLLPILVADLINPILFAFLVYATGRQHPVANSSAILLGHTLAYFSVGIILALGLERITERLVNPYTIDYVIGLIIGMLLIRFAFPSSKKAEKRQSDDQAELTPLKAIGLGAIVNFVGIPFALPYFAALDQILKANLSAHNSLLVLAVYNLLYALPFMIVPVFSLVMGERSQSLLQQVNAFMDQVSNFLMPVFLAIAGLALISDAVMFFLTGAGLF